MVKPATTWVVILLAANVGWVVGAATPARPGFVALVAMLVVGEVAVTRIALGEGDAEAGRGWAWIEFLGLVVGVQVVHLLTVGTAAASELAAGRLVEPETVTGWVVGGLVWGLAHATLRDVELLGYPGDGPGEPGPVERLRGRLFGVGFVLAVVGSVAVVGVGGVVDIDRAPAAGPMLPVLAYFTVGIFALGRAAFRHEERQWARDGARVDPDVDGRWNGMLALVVGTVLVVGLAVPPRTSGMGGLTPALTRLAASIGSAAFDWFEGPGADGSGGSVADGPSSGPVRVVERRVSRRGDRGADLVRDISMLVVLAAGLGLAFIRWERRKGGGVRGRAGSLGRALWRLVRDGLVALVRALARLLRGAGTMLGRVAVDRSTPAETGGEDLRWVPPDEVRRRVVAEYRSFLAEAEPAVGTRRPSESSGEFGDRVAALLADPGPVRRLTGVFDLARYTRRPLTPSAVDEAATARAELTGRFGGEGSEVR